MAQFQPVVGEWYQTPGGELFEVVAYDSDEDVVEIQYFDGALEELDRETWDELAIEPAEAPEDWSGPMDIVSEDMQDMNETVIPRAHDGYDYMNDIDSL